MAIKIHYFIQASTEYSKNNQESGHHSLHLSQEGIEEAKAIGEAYPNIFDAIYCSDLRQSIQTVEYAWGRQTRLIFNECLRECDYGEFTQADKSWDMEAYIEKAYPWGESYLDVQNRIQKFLTELCNFTNGGEIAIVSGIIPKLVLDVMLTGLDWEEAIAAHIKSYKRYTAYEINDALHFHQIDDVAILV